MTENNADGTPYDRTDKSAAEIELVGQDEKLADAKPKG